MVLMYSSHFTACIFCESESCELKTSFVLFFASSMSTSDSANLVLLLPVIGAPRYLIVELDLITDKLWPSMLIVGRSWKPSTIDVHLFGAMMSEVLLQYVTNEFIIFAAAFSSLEMSTRSSAYACAVKLKGPFLYSSVMPSSALNLSK